MHFSYSNANNEKHNVGTKLQTGKRQIEKFLGKVKSRAVACGVVASSLLLAACAEESPVEPGRLGAVQGFFGAVAADEPTATLVGRNVLSAGGTAADAAVAMSFAMSVTYPSRVGLGGGGVCLMHDGAIGLTETLDFTGPSGSLKIGDRPVAIPALTRGMASLHARYGLLDWRNLVLPAENLARNGYRLSRAASVDLNAATALLLEDSRAAAVFAGDDGRIIAEGKNLEQIDLSVVLSKIRIAGAGTFYQGPFARQVVAAVQEAGGNISESDLRDYLPEWRGILGVPFNDQAAYFPAPPAGGGSVAAQALGMLLADDLYLDANEADRPHLVAEAFKQAYLLQQQYIKAGWESKESSDALTDEETLVNYAKQIDRSAASLTAAVVTKFTENADGAGFVVVDRFGNAAACEFSLNNRFGTGRMAPGLGFMLAASPTTRTRNPLNLSPVIVAASFNGSFTAAAAGSGASDKKIATVEAILNTVADKSSNVQDALSKPRFAMSPNLGSLIAEDGADGLKKQLQVKGHGVQSKPATSRLNMVYCRLGLPQIEEKTTGNCITGTDPRGHGFTIIATQ